MPPKSPVSGVSGAVRIQRLSPVAFAAAEAHGKRLDDAGKARAIYDAKPITTSGLDLGDLYAKHIEGAKVPKSGTKALHLVLQFPTELVDGEKGEAMLKHARAFAASVFGDDAILADRVDRDEKSRHVVDLFLAPRYTKATKHKSETAISTSRHLKALAENHGKAPTLRGQGQALQDAWFQYLTREMGLSVQRGSAKKRAGDDWVTPEDLDRERVQEENQALAAENRELQQKNEAEKAKLAEAQKNHVIGQILGMVIDEKTTLIAQQNIQTKAPELDGLSRDVAQKKTNVTSLRAKKAALEAKLRTLSAA